MNSRLEVIDASISRMSQPLCDAVYSSLSSSQKSLPCRFFYDHAGSHLFERITALPEYYLTRCEAEILKDKAEDILDAVGHDVTLVEFGSGSSAKTRHIFEAALNRRRTLHYVPIDISREFLTQSSQELLEHFPGLSVTAIAAEYSDAMASVPSYDGPRLFLFLGSNIGNFEHAEAQIFLAQIAKFMTPRDRILLGADLVKDRSVLFDAYNDSEGVTAEFNMNLLRRINRDLGANFDLDGFEHFAPFDEDHSRIEMRLVSKKRQSVYVADLETTFEFEPDEFIQTEWSHKYSRESAQALAKEAGLEIEREWTDSKGYFAEFLLKTSANAA